MKHSILTIEQLRLDMALHNPNGSIYKAALAELEKRYEQPPDISNEPAIIEILQHLNKRWGKSK